MSKYTFIKQPDPDNWMEEGDSKLTVEICALDLDLILEEFTYFLRGAGFFANGHLEFVHDEELITIPDEDDDLVILDGTEDNLDNIDQFFGKAKDIAKKLDEPVFPFADSKETWEQGGDPAHPPSYKTWPIKSNPQTDDE